MSDLDFHPADYSDSDLGQASKELEGSIESFGDGESLKKPFKGEGSIEGEVSENRPGPAGFIDVSQDPLQTVGTDRKSPPILTESPENLAATRVDQEDMIVAEPDLETGQEIAVLKKTAP